MTIRTYRPEDCPVLARLFYDTVHTVNAKDYAPAQLDAWADGNVDLGKWNESFLAHHTLVAEVDGVIAGFGDMAADGYLDRLYVHKDYQGRGIAAALCDGLEKTSQSGEFTVHASITARPFFEKRGYAVEKEQQVERHGVLLTNFVMRKKRKTLYLIGGAMGVGKTTVCRELKRLLPGSVLLDGDWCWDMHPFTVTEETKAMVMDNICHCLNNFLKCSALENVVFCWVMDRQEILDDILSRLDLTDCRVISVSLTCTPEALRCRLQKDIDAGLRTADILGRSAARLPHYECLNTEKLDTTGKTAKEIARLLAGR